MKNLSLFVILSLFFTPTIGLADKKFQIEETLFDLKATSTSSNTYTLSGKIQGGRGESPSPLENVKIILDDLFSNVKYTKRTDSEGKYSFDTPLNFSNEYILTCKKPGYGSRKIGISKEKGESLSIFDYIFQTGYWRSNSTCGGAIFGNVINNKGNYSNQNEITIEGIKTNYKNNLTTEDSYYQFFALKPDTYIIKVKSKTYKIKLEKSMSYYLDLKVP